MIQRKKKKKKKERKKEKDTFGITASVDPRNTQAFIRILEDISSISPRNACLLLVCMPVIILNKPKIYGYIILRLSALYDSSVSDSYDRMLCSGLCS